MATQDVLATVADRLVGGMMFHADHADICMYLGYRKLAGMHEDGFEHDSSCYREVHRLGIEYLGLIVKGGRQERNHAVDAYSENRNAVSQDVRMAAVKDAMAEWIDWEAATATILKSAYKRLWDAGEMSLAKAVLKMVRDTESELAEARDLNILLSASGWDPAYLCDKLD
jgi:hypothetical protein